MCTDLGPPRHACGAGHMSSVLVLNWHQAVHALTGWDWACTGLERGAAHPDHSARVGGESGGALRCSRAPNVAAASHGQVPIIQLARPPSWHGSSHLCPSWGRRGAAVARLWDEQWRSARACLLCEAVSKTKLQPVHAGPSKHHLGVAAAPQVLGGAGGAAAALEAQPRLRQQPVRRRGGRPQEAADAHGQCGKEAA